MSKSIQLVIRTDCQRSIIAIDWLKDISLTPGATHCGHGNRYCIGGNCVKKWKYHFLTSGPWVEPGSQSDSDAKYCKNCEIFPRFVCWVGSWVNENWPKAESVVTKTKVDSVDKNFGFAFLMFNFYSRVLICHLHVYMYTCIHWLKLER